jgi:hypothetical protein
MSAIYVLKKQDIGKSLKVGKIISLISNDGFGLPAGQLK